MVVRQIIGMDLIKINQLFALIKNMTLLFYGSGWRIFQPLLHLA